jgi:hypothetical protein
MELSEKDKSITVEEFAEVRFLISIFSASYFPYCYSYLILCDFLR